MQYAESRRSSMSTTAAIHAIKGISFDVDEGEIVTLIGANGAGKSTTLNTISGLLQPRSRLASSSEGKDIGNRPRHKIVMPGHGPCAPRDAGSSCR